jgi:parallel beta-helix repeat protein
VLVSNSTVAANNVIDVNIFGNYFWANVNDAVTATAFVPSGGKILELNVSNNWMECNGWPANGTGFSAACTPGFMQTGATGSGGGVGVDIITNANQLVVRPSIIGNHMHDNVFEGVSVTSNVQACAAVSTFTTVTETTPGLCGLSANQPFNTNWKAGETVAINSILYPIAFVSSSTVLTLAKNGVNGNGGAVLPSYMWATVEGNEIFNNGSNVQSPATGPGIYCQLSDGNTFIGNVMRNNNFEGLELFGCSYSTSTGDRAYSNDINGTANRNYGFVSYGGLGNQFIGDTADDPVASPTQTVGLFIDANSKNTVAYSSSLHGSVAPVTDSGILSRIDTNLTEKLPGALISAGTHAVLTGTGACTTITTQAGGAWAGSAKCTGSTGASTFIITPGTTAPNGWSCSASDITTANAQRQSASSATACTISGTVNTNDVLTFQAVAF